MWFLKLVISLLCLLVGHIESVKQDEIEWTSFVTTGSGLTFKWYMEDPDWLTMEMEAPTSGYVAIGFSPVAGMANSDIVMGWVDAKGEPQLVDLHALGNTVPLMDKSQDYELLDANENGGMTSIRFRRKWNTCDDKHDYKIGDETIKLIWAFGDEDPDLNTPKFNPAYHEGSRGVRNVFLRLAPKHEEFPDEPGTFKDPSVKHIDFLANKAQINSTDYTTYTCEMMRFPDFDTKHHLIGWRPLIQPENAERLHHMIIFECVPPNGEDSYAMFEEHVGRVESCYTPNMPPVWSTNCWNTLLLWTLGSEGDMYPPHVGIPMGQKHGGATYFMLETHYDNPNKIEFQDTSGLRFFYTDKPRENDLGILWIGSRISGFQFVPPGAKDFNSVSACTSECTSQGIPKEGIRGTHVILHSHKAARRVGLKHIRNGQELEPMGEDNHYDNYYQQARNLNPERLILPGDTLLTYCEYETLNLEKPLYGGAETNDSEMCIIFLQYYPRIPLASCEWQPEFNGFLETLGIQKVSGKVLDLLQLPYRPVPGQRFDPPEEPVVLLNNDLPTSAFEQMTVEQPARLRGKTVADVIEQTDFKRNNKRVVQDMTRKFGEKGKHYSFCTESGRVRIPLSNYITTAPRYKDYVRPVDKSCKAKPNRRG